VVLLVALLRPRRRTPLFAVVIGLAIHFWRDMADPSAGVSLLWPVSCRVFSYAHRSYLVAMSAVIGVNACRCFRDGRCAPSR
jgi:hypothetical protein